MIQTTRGDDLVDSNSEMRDQQPLEPLHVSRVAGIEQLELDFGMLFSTLSERRDVRSQVWVGWGEGVVNTET